MNTYQLRVDKNKDILFFNTSQMYPHEFEKRINDLAGEQITQVSEDSPLPFFMPNFINTFVVKKEKWDIFVERVLPHIGLKEEFNNNTVWDNREEVEANLI